MWCLYIFVSQDGSIENSANTIDYPLKIIWCNSSWLTMSVLPRISSKHRQFRANRRFQMAAHKQTLARLIWRLDILIEGRYQVVSQELKTTLVKKYGRWIVSNIIVPNWMAHSWMAHQIEWLIFKLNGHYRRAHAHRMLGRTRGARCILYASLSRVRLFFNMAVLPCFEQGGEG